ncbi:MAG: hypothetical protein HY841_02265 [Bacteroidetes bacterium]|nr:hypothetical protein [Bacteroidota bacterium]
MKSKIFTPRFLFITIAILLAALSRVLPHPFNFTPIGAMALFGGACLSNKKLAFIIPLLAMFISDCILELFFGYGFHNTIIYVYASFVLITFIGIYIRSNAKAGTIILASLISSVLFFVVTNFGVWQVAAPMQSGAAGLLSTYLIAIPFYSNDLFGSFFLNTIMGDLFFSGILFGSLYFAKAKFPALVRA